MEELKQERARFKELETKNPPIQHITVNLSDLQSKDKYSRSLSRDDDEKELI